MRNMTARSYSCTTWAQMIALLLPWNILTKVTLKQTKREKGRVTRNIHLKRGQIGSIGSIDIFNWKQRHLIGSSDIQLEASSFSIGSIDIQLEAPTFSIGSINIFNWKQRHSIGSIVIFNWNRHFQLEAATFNWEHCHFQLESTLLIKNIIIILKISMIIENYLNFSDVTGMAKEEEAMSGKVHFSQFMNHKIGFRFKGFLSGEPYLTLP